MKKGVAIKTKNIMEKLINDSETFQIGDNVILDSGLEAIVVDFRNELLIVKDERGLILYKQAYKVKHQ